MAFAAATVRHRQAKRQHAGTGTGFTQEEAKLCACMHAQMDDRCMDKCAEADMPPYITDIYYIIFAYVYI